MVTLAVTVNGVNSNLWLFFVWVFLFRHLTYGKISHKINKT